MSSNDAQTLRKPADRQTARLDPRLLATLCRAERELQLCDRAMEAVDELAARHRQQLGGWLATDTAAEYAIELQAEPMQARLPGLQSEGVSGLVELPEGAEVPAAPLFCLNHAEDSIRALYPGLGLSLWCQLCKRDRARALSRSVETRRLTRKAGHLPQPELLGWGRLKGPRRLRILWVLERMETGPNLAEKPDDSLLRNLIFPALIRHHQATALTPRPARKFLPKPHAHEAEALTRLRRANPLVPVAQCHNGLSAKHILQGPEGWTITGWHSAAASNPGCDLISLALDKPSVEETAVSLLGACLAHDRSAAEMLQVATLLRLATPGAQGLREPLMTMYKIFAEA